MPQREIPPPTPGEILKEEFLVPLGLSVTDFASNIGVAETVVSEFIDCKRAITPELAAAFSGYFKNTPDFWMNLQNNYDREIADEQ